MRLKLREVAPPVNFDVCNFAPLISSSSNESRTKRRPFVCNGLICKNNKGCSSNCFGLGFEEKIFLIFGHRAVHVFPPLVLLSFRRSKWELLNINCISPEAVKPRFDILLQSTNSRKNGYNRKYSDAYSKEREKCTEFVPFEGSKGKSDTFKYQFENHSYSSVEFYHNLSFIILFSSLNFVAYQKHQAETLS